MKNDTLYNLAQGIITKKLRILYFVLQLNFENGDSVFPNISADYGYKNLSKFVYRKNNCQIKKHDRIINVKNNQHLVQIFVIIITIYSFVSRSL